jgi:Zn-dependent peptidase ImmA (M78 family)
MRERRGFPSQALARSIAFARLLVEGHSDAGMSPGERLRDIGKKLKVSRIESGAVRTAGFLRRLDDRTFAVYYASDCSVARRRFTVAHELAHLVLEKFHRHIGHKHLDPRTDGHPPELEKAVDRIAAELLMPERLVVDLMRRQCQLQREESDSGTVQKQAVVRAVGRSLGVSENALVHRLLELPDLLSALLRVQWKINQGPERARYSGVMHSKHSYFRVVDASLRDPRIVQRQDGWEHLVHVQTKWGLRVIRCHGWRRPADPTEPGQAEAWIFGWSWNTFPLLEWDDSEQKGGTPDVLRVREFEAAL